MASIIHFQNGAGDKQAEVRALINERPLTIHVLGGQDYTIMRTPDHDLELATGFLFSEGVVDRFDEILMLDQCPSGPDRIQVRLHGARKMPRRSLHLISSCGLCGREDIEKLVHGLEPVTDDFTVRAEYLYVLPRAVLARQALFQQTGGSHAAALFEAEGDILILREDVGRHNALDKVLGHALARKISFKGKGIYLSGRASLEMIVKAARAQIAVVAAASAPTALAVELAQRVGITLCGFVRGQEIAVYSHDRRIQPGKGR
jgi:FdhD protein